MPSLCFGALEFKLNVENMQRSNAKNSHVESEKQKYAYESCLLNKFQKIERVL